MKLNEYQDKAMTTCMATCDNFSYMMLNLVAEVGELAGKVAKDIRKGKKEIYGSELKTTFAWEGSSETEETELMKEAGDILWQLSGLCRVMGWTLEEVAQMNLDKLASRQQRGKIDGDGDNR